MRRREIGRLAVGAAGLTAAAVAAFLLEGWLQANPLGAAIIGALVVDVLGGRLGMVWDETRKVKALGVVLATLRGFALGAGVTMLIVVVALMLGWVRVGRGSPSLVGLGLGLATPLAIAARDEMLYRGLPLAVMRDLIPDRWALPFTALLGAAPVVLRPGASVIGVVLAAAAGAFFAILWRLGRGGWTAWGAHAGFLFMAGAGLHGALLDTWFRDGAVVPFARAHGNPAWLGALLFALAAFVAAWWFARRAPHPSNGSPSARD